MSKPVPVNTAVTAAEFESELSRAIENGTFAPGDRIGAERDLAERHGVTRWMVRRALEGLEDRGLIYRTHGRSGGIFVSHPRVVRDLDGLVGLPEYLRAQGIDAGTTVLETGVVAADEHLSEALELREGDLVIRVIRARFSAGEALELEWCHFPAEMFPGLLDESLVGSLYELLETKFDLVRGEALETIEARSADYAVAEILHIPPGSPVLSVRRVARTQDAIVFEYSRELYRAERVAITVPTRGKRSPARRAVTD